MAAENTKAAIGQDFFCVPDINDCLKQAVRDRFDFITVPLVHPRLRRDDIGVSDARTGPFTRSDLLLDSRTWTTSVVGKLSPWINMDSPSPAVRDSSIKAFKQELAWASHLGVPAIIGPRPEFRCFNYAHYLNHAVAASTYLNVWVRVPLVYPHVAQEESKVESKHELLAGTGFGRGSGATAGPEAATGAGEASACATPGTSEAAVTGSAATVITECAEPEVVATALARRPRDDPWEAWNTLRTLCEHNPNVGVCLELTENVPSNSTLEKWYGEPVRACVIPTSIFITNKSGFPVLSKVHQKIVKTLYNHKCQFMISGRARGGKIRFYLEYIEHLFDSMPDLTEQEEFEAPYLDYLQMPLQPLADNLESQTYETFERDPIKYRQYEEAVKAALLDTPTDKVTVLMVVGAGRGPLVRASLRASIAASRTIRVYAVEKNPNAVITLRNMKAALGWGDKVTIVSSDMRVWKAPELADILVSELLGSFGDNELSPECLDGAQKFLKEGGISIPYEYTSYIAPVTSSKLWNEVKAYKELKHFETAYVVKLFNFKELAAAKPCFRFWHPNPTKPINNKRYTFMSFKSKDNAMIHGMAGYFEAMLYKDISISINPATFSEGMFSWFPLYFPIRDPTYVEAGQTIEVHMWRNVSSSKVWYEWCLSSPSVSQLHNPNGRSYYIGL